MSVDLRSLLDVRRRQKSPKGGQQQLHVNSQGSPLRRIVEPSPPSPQRRTPSPVVVRREWRSPSPSPLPLLRAGGELVSLEMEIERSQREIDRKIALNERRQQEIDTLQMNALDKRPTSPPPNEDDDLVSWGSLPREEGQARNESLEQIDRKIAQNEKRQLEIVDLASEDLDEEKGRRSSSVVELDLRSKANSDKGGGDGDGGRGSNEPLPPGGEKSKDTKVLLDHLL